MIEMSQLKSKNQVKKSQFHVTSPLLPRLRGRGVIVLAISEPRFRHFWKAIRLKMYPHSNVFGLKESIKRYFTAVT